MNECGIDKCWTKTYSFEPLSYFHSVLGFRPNFEVLMLCAGGIVSYNLSTHEINEYNELYKRLELLLEAVQVFQYAESLISVKRRVD
ncbi:hypothetical protein RHMOL_Rhmol06G0037400 [Rhododendron molle]|uniref:Uncharacterized protein n=1 Tax=Rhododendron molle TaxID=49168 RepID=A0ACC0N948_RHOML|nr:hypothetical protein RHMOL_Rhmol06G0037400 [Rhododendron molle]